MTHTQTRTRTREEFALAIAKDALEAARAVAARVSPDLAGAFTFATERGTPTHPEVTGASRENSLLITVLEEAVFRAQQDLDMKTEASERAAVHDLVEDDTTDKAHGLLNGPATHDADAAPPSPQESLL